MESNNLSQLVIDHDEHHSTSNFELMGGAASPVSPVSPVFFGPNVGSSDSITSQSYQGLMYQQNQYSPLMFSSDYGPSSTHHGFPPLQPLMLDHQTCSVKKQSTLFQPPCSLMGSLSFFDPNKPFVSTRSATSCSSSSMVLPRWDSSVTRAARTKRRMARQMSSSSSSRLQSVCSSASSSSSSTSSASSPSSFSSARSAMASDANAAQNGVYCFTASDGNRLRFILEKQLKNSDVNTLGRIILPKKASEANLPSLDVKEGIQVAVKDVNSEKTWYMRYRFWPNNKSRMYVMENTGDYVRVNGLKSGDFVILYHDEKKQLEEDKNIDGKNDKPQKFLATCSMDLSQWIRSLCKSSFKYISCKKAERQASVPSPEEELRGEETRQDLAAVPWSLCQNVDEETMLAAPQPLDHASIMNPPEKIDDDHMGNIGESIFKNYIDYDFSDLENLPDFGDCDLTLYDDLMRNITNDNDSGGGDGVLK